MKKVLLFSFLFLCAGALRAQIITTVAGSDSEGYNGDHILATDARLLGTYDIALDGKGSFYIADGYNNRIRKVDTAGIITTIAGTGTNGYNGDNIPATNAELYHPAGIICDSVGNIFIVDAFNDRIRKIDINGIITTIAGTGVAGYNGDNIAATAAEINNPHSVALDAAGNLYISEWDGHRIRKINTLGIITTIAGTGIPGYTGDNGLASVAEINTPYGIAIDHSGNVYFVDSYENIIRKVSVSGIITTFAGGGIGLSIGDNGPANIAKLAGPGGISIDRNDDIYIADIENQRIRKIISTSGIITTIVGNGIQGFSGDNGLAVNAQLNQPAGIKVDNSGNLYVADFGNHRVRRIGWPENVTATTEKNEKISLFPNPATKRITIGCMAKITSIVIDDYLGRVVYSKQLDDKQVTIDVSDLPNGIYMVRINNSEVRKFMKF